MSAFPRYHSSPQFLSAYGVEEAAAELQVAALVIRGDVEAAVLVGPRQRLRSAAWVFREHRMPVEVLVYQRRPDLIPLEFYCLVAEIVGPSQPEEQETVELHFGERPV